MRKFSLPHAAKWVVACVSCIVGSLIFQGCGDNLPNPYADLDAEYPNGPIDAQKRAQDKEYMAQISEEAQKISTCANEIAQYEAKLAHIRSEFKKSLELKNGGVIPDVILAEELAKVPLYQETLAKYNEAVAAGEAARQQSQRMIRDRLRAEVEAYNVKLAEANAKARALGLPTREEQNRADAAAKAPSAEVTPKAPVPTAESLSRETGIPLAPATKSSSK